MTRVAVLSDIHGNVDALDAVLVEVDVARPDRIVICGDVAAGPFPGETLARVQALPGAVFVSGNGDRMMVEAFDAGLREDEAADAAAASLAWATGRLGRAERDYLASFAPTVRLDCGTFGVVRFCHGSPRSDEEIITSLTPEPVLATFLAEVEEEIVVSGHTHVQFDRRAVGRRLLNPGSVGMPYEVRPGAFWLLLHGTTAEFRCTLYDVAAAAARIRACGYPEGDNLGDILLAPPAAAEAEQFFEQVAAERGERT